MAAASIHYPWYKKEDTDAFFALFQNNIANFVIIAITMPVSYTHLTLPTILRV